MAVYLTKEDIANRALQSLGAQRITTFDDDHKNASAVKLAYDKVRQSELRRSIWRFAIRTATLRPIDDDTLFFTPRAWSATTYYQPGMLVSYASAVWTCNSSFSINEAPGTTDHWVPYFGPITVDEFDDDLTYNTGEMVYINAVGGLAATYVSRINDNAVSPATADVYSATTTYDRGDIVSSVAHYISLITANINNTPASALALWVAATTYASAAQVITVDGTVWTSQGNGNIGHEPSADSGTNWLRAASLPLVQPWLLYTGGVTGAGWRQLDPLGFTTSLRKPNIIYPAGVSPASVSGTQHIYPLPLGYLRQAPQEPRAGAGAFLGAPGGLRYSDWKIENRYIISQEIDPIAFRFVADVTAVPEMDPMFCDALSKRLAFDICEELTQSSTKKQACWVEYKNFMGEARAVNAIETGPIEPEEDDYITVRA